ncbi:hypothetical protein [Gilliamella apicola]|uniref:hypothetical protein n=1 Tax=Gilliamella apicola TaxID=1196095 RepID=UPI00046CCAF8|nr:hypothetical protein [Gilliamella apicola]PXV89272.1 hypothetical protein C7392_11653 [Gilliamella apicola]
MKNKLISFLFTIFALSSISFCSSAEMLGGNKLLEWEGGHYREDIRMYTLTSIDYIKGEPEFDFISLSDDIDLYDNKYKKDIYLIPSAEKKLIKKNNIYSRVHTVLNCLIWQVYQKMIQYLSMIT